MTTKTDPRTIACQLYLLSQQEKDPTILFLEILSSVDPKISQEVIKEYKNIRSGELKIAQISSAQELTEEQKKKLEKKISTDFGENVIFLYSLDTSMVSGFCLQIGDLLYDRSLEALLS
ncbi:MAG: F0F1 ATP synthase subunit delta [Candidatus Shapirobacteria bacterium]|nr:F0F1 ATP synthase subunit delta [Candidatus Shapirobacteria bacterium]